jgi:hypothetical protein
LTIFDLFFMVVVLATVVILIAVVLQVLLAHFRKAVKLLVIYGAGIVLYLGVIVVVSITSPQRVLAIGDIQCFDDWCVAVDTVTLASELGQGEHFAKPIGDFYVITLRLSNQALGREQRASSVAVHLLDDQGRTFDVSPQGQGAYESQHGPVAPLTSTLPVGQSITIVQVFDLPNDAHDIGLTIEHPVGPSPGLFIIGDDASLFHKPTIVRLP